ncbi:uncharacterized protein LOC106663977 isoform X2 [Cimex lectularius]|uniref:Uncharacterized protein n=1 Tax=Cimex lectularius TaxID=79782 RepID=A0A8I6TM51_CIMLE|nr:uncharacterized protein LOC106663977 isoform X2 [Cimex lectularius]
MAAKIDPNDPRVRKLVYNAYRNILGTYNQKANKMIDTLPKGIVVEDQGITKQLESMMRQSSQIAASNGSTGFSAGGPPPPPPPPVQGSIPPVRIASEIGPKKHYEPPAAIQNAMMTKDKKPFTYTPGGLDLAQIRSPRMAKRISRNAHMEDSCTPQLQQRPPGAPTQPLPPSALAAMQPQIAIPVFPPGGGFSNTPSHGQSSPSLPPPPPMPVSPEHSGFPPPPPLPAFNTNSDDAPDFPPPPPPLQNPGTPGTPSFTGAMNFPPPPPPLPEANTSYQNTQANYGQNGSGPKNGNRSPPSYLNDIQNRPALRSVGPANQYRPPPSDFVAEIPCHAPLRPTNQPPKSSFDPNNTQASIQVQLKPVSPKPVPVSNCGPPYIPVQPVYIQPKPAEVLFDNKQQPAYEPSHHTVVIPVQNTKPTPLQMPTNQQPPTPPKQMPPTPGSATKSPAPWMTSRQQSKESPPPWAIRQNQVESPQPQNLSQQQPTGSVTRVIPIQIEGREPQPTSQPQPTYQPQQPSHQQYQSPVYQQQSPSPVYQQVPNFQQQGAPMTQEQVKTRIIPIQIEGAESPRNYSSQQSVPNQNSPHSDNLQRTTSVDGSRQLQSQNSWSQGTSNPIQSRSFRVLQKITGSDEEATGPFQNPGAETFLVNRVFPPQATAPVGADNNMCWDPNTPPPYYPNPNYWYYPPKNPEEQQKFWEHYNAMCAYMAQMNAAAIRYSPYPMYPYVPTYPSDSEEYSGYSSSDEMSYYGHMFKKQAELQAAAQKQYYDAQLAAQNQQQLPTPQNVQSAEQNSKDDNNRESDNSPEQNENSDESDTDTEVEEECKPIALQSIKSVPNLNVYISQSPDSSSEESDLEELEEEESDSELPHQLSVIFEESEHSSDAESFKKHAIKKEIDESDAGSSPSTLNNNEEDDDSPVVVRLPLQFKISRSENDEEVTTVIVGNSEVNANSEEKEGNSDNLIITEIIKENSDPDVTATINLNLLKRKSMQKDVSEVTMTGSEKSDSESPTDFWRDIHDKETDIAKSPNTVNETQSLISEDDSKHEESDYHWEDDSSSTSIQTVKKGLSESENFSGSEVEVPSNVEENENAEDEEAETCDEEKHETETLLPKSNDSSNETSSSEEETDNSDEDSSDSSSDNEESDVEKEKSTEEKAEPCQNSEIQTKCKLEKLTSLEESEEDDSGVTSDISRHISETDTGSDAECTSELRKMTRYQRAATHSRLFKLLQDECGVEQENVDHEPLAMKRERLTLPLNTQNIGEQESLSSSSGINSPLSPTATDRLVKELVQSLLSRKKGRHFRKLPLEKLHAAALKILQEDMDPYDTGSTSDDSSFFLSPASNPQSNSSEVAERMQVEIPNPETYGVNYYDYCNYYNTWANPDRNRQSGNFEDYDIVPSKTFKILQDNSQIEPVNSQTTKGIVVRCPRVSSSRCNNPNHSPDSTLTPREPETSGPQET